MRKEKAFNLFWAMASAMLAFTSTAWAADGESTASNPMTAQTLGDVMSNAAGQTFLWSDVLSWAAYLLGAIVAYSAIKNFKHVMEGGNMPLSVPIWRMTAAASLVALPWLLSMILGTLGLTAFTPATRGASVTTGTGAGLDTLMANFVNNMYLPAKYLFGAICYIGGGLSGLIGLRRLAEAGKGGNHQSTTGGAIAYLVGGAVLISFAQMMDLVTSSLFGQANPGTFTALAFVPSGISTAQATNVFAALFNFVELIGWIAFIRGIFVLRGIAEGKSNRTPTQGFIFLVAGAIAVNMYGFIKVLQTTLGLSLIT